MPELGVAGALVELGGDPTRDRAACDLHEEHPAESVVLGRQAVDHLTRHWDVVVTGRLHGLDDPHRSVLAIAHEANVLGPPLAERQVEQAQHGEL